MGNTNTTKTDQNQTQTNNPWAPAMPALTAGIPGLAAAFGQSQANNAATLPSQFVAGLTPQQIATFNQMVNYGTNNPIPGTQQGAGTGLTNTGAGATDYFTRALEGYNPAASYNLGNIINGANSITQGFNIPGAVKGAMQSAEEAARDVTLPGIAGAANASGNTNSSRSDIQQGIVERGLAEQAGGLSAELQNSIFGQGLGTTSGMLNSNNANLLAALSAGGATGVNAANAGTNVLNSSVNNAGNIFDIAGTGGTGLQQGNQLTLNNQIAANQFGTQNPFSSYNNYLPLLESIGAMGGTSNTQGTTTQQYTPSTLSLLASVMGAGGSILGGSNQYGTTGLGGLAGVRSLFPAAAVA